MRSASILQIPLTAARCGSGRCFARIGSAHARPELRQRRYITKSPVHHNPTLWPPHNTTQHTRRPATFSTMHRAPAAMVTKTMVDPNIEIRTPRDPNTLSNYHNFVTRHTSVDFDIDFSKKRLFGSVVLTLESLTDEEVKDVVLDSRYVCDCVQRRARVIRMRELRSCYSNCFFNALW
jgi:hypothetical protein